MPLKIIFLYDSASDPLQVKGIRVELYDASTATLLDTANSADLNPGPAGQAIQGVGRPAQFPDRPQPAGHLYHRSAVPLPRKHCSLPQWKSPGSALH
jgi:hypothetical protein